MVAFQPDSAGPPDLSFSPGTITDMAICGIVCDKTGFGMTIVDGNDVKDHRVRVPTGLQTDRPAALAWLLDEAERALSNFAITDVRVWAAPTKGRFAASAPRIEAETCVKIAAARKGAIVAFLNKEQLRAAFGVTKGPGAYDSLLQRPDVAARKSKQCQEQYLLATAPDI